MPRPKALLFDFGGTLDNDGIDWFTRLYRLINARDARIAREFFHTHADRVAKGLDKLPDTRTLSMRDLAGRLCAQIHQLLAEESTNGAPEFDPDEVTKAFMTEAEQVLRRNFSLLPRLRESYRLGCISNNWGNTAGWCREYGFDGHFEVIVDSTVVGAAKPDPAIFEAALKDLGLPAQDCAYIGDWYDADMIGARRAGLMSIWLDDGQKVCPDEAAVDYRITKLPQILELPFD